MLCYYVMLCYVMLCYVMLYLSQSETLTDTLNAETGSRALAIKTSFVTHAGFQLLRTNHKT